MDIIEIPGDDFAQIHAFLVQALWFCCPFQLFTV
jgi:hypothetical protein